MPTPLPYADAGLTDREAAAFALDRLAFGPTPEALRGALRVGVDAWVEGQISAREPDREVERRVARLGDMDRPLAELAASYRTPTADEQAAFERDYDGELPPYRSRPYRDALEAYWRERGVHPFRELTAKLTEAKILRAAFSQNQLREVLADFWYNHFNVSARAQAVHRAFAYDRDAIRPHVLGRFRTLLGATARHPAMLVYLDNRRSRAAEGVRTPVGRSAPGGGINENYGRELLELHTLGVDGGYTQADVEATARAFTGWAVYPYDRPGRQRRWDPVLRREPGALRVGEFFFRPSWHDAEPKRVLGRALPAGRGIEDGEDVLDLVAAHPSTARHVSRKLAIRFVADDPPEALVDALAQTFTRTRGDIREVMRALVRRREFWEAATGADGQPTKVKTPFELAVSAVRATGAEITSTRRLTRELAAMGEPVYQREPPTGFPDHAAAWINPGLLLTRMRFGLRLAAGRVPGIEPDLGSLASGAAPATAPEALGVYGEALLPGRDLGPTADVMEEMVLAQDVAARVESAADEAAGASGAARPRPRPRQTSRRGYTPATVVGILLGSPAFQRQ